MDLREERTLLDHDASLSGTFKCRPAKITEPASTSTLSHRVSIRCNLAVLIYHHNAPIGAHFCSITQTSTLLLSSPLHGDSVARIPWRAHSVALPGAVIVSTLVFVAHAIVQAPLPPSSSPRGWPPCTIPRIWQCSNEKTARDLHGSVTSSSTPTPCWPFWQSPNRCVSNGEQNRINGGRVFKVRSCIERHGCKGMRSVGEIVWYARQPQSTRPSHHSRS